jgi:2-keto-4-pentenoate hydratase/2-oxohepta-3-ene-1,7-dioic acid hydratase in catechol pathway
MEGGEPVVTAAAGPYGRIAFGDESYPPEEVDVLPPCEPTKIIAVGRNYADHAAEHDADVPDRPMLFIKPPNTVASHNSTVTLLPDKERIDYEAELGVVIGEQCRSVSEAGAMDVVAGFTCLNDISNRDDQRQEQNWVRGKAFDNSCPIGPLVATPEHVPADASIELRLNGEVEQSASREDMVFSVPELIAEITEYITLVPGDVIATGTPDGVGPLSNGDHVAIEIEGVGTLEHSVRIP